MGMFDDIHYKGKSYQTKDLENHLLLYSVSDDGRLLYHVGHSDTETEDLNYHGIINIYDGIEDLLLKFTNGDLVSVEEIKDVDVP